jgi:hypothetical protein
MRTEVPGGRIKHWSFLATSPFFYFFLFLFGTNESKFICHVPTFRLGFGLR